MNGLDYAMRTGVKRKRQLLARVVRKALSDDAVIDQAQLITDTLGQLDALHIRALERARDVLQSAAEGWEKKWENSCPSVPAWRKYGELNPSP